MIWLLVACSTGAPESAADSGVEFPHAAGYDLPAAHGAEALKLGSGACVSCHREGAQAPSCTSCHEGYPHPAGWLPGATHGAGLSGEAGAAAREPCAKCHGVEGSTAPSCTSCHTSWPHPEGWELGGQHGPWVLARGSATAACGSCHGAALEGTSTAPACTACHADYPHPAGWAAVTGHPLADRATCAGCHGADLGGGTSGVACAQCHAGFPHADGWSTGHMTSVQTLGQTGCLACHDEGAAVVLPASCGSRCHGGTP